MRSVTRHDLVPRLAKSLLAKDLEDSVEKLFSTGEGRDEITDGSS